MRERGSERHTKNERERVRERGVRDTQRRRERV